MAIDCIECGADVPSGEGTCPNCGANVDPATSSGEGRSESGELSDVADALRRDQWSTSVILAVGGALVAVVLVGAIVKRAFIDSGDLAKSGAAYADSKKGVRGYIEETVLPQLEMKYETSSDSNIDCELDGFSLSWDEQLD